MRKPLPLGNIPLTTFLAEYWQKQPLLIRQGWPNCQAPTSPEELAGLACEERVESRLILQKGGGRWELHHGPFTDETFRALPRSHWTLLVQAVDHWVPDAARFLDRFDFIPSWRMDDLMISYSADQGGVGPHYDHYDVFLVQVRGRRQWEIGGLCHEQSPRLADTALAILADWEPERRWVLEPGDLLYLPPRIGHNGIAIGSDCMTCSVGFRAPSHADMLREFAEFVAGELDEGLRYADPDLREQRHPGRISPQALKKVRAVLRQYFADSGRVAEWFGRMVTAPKYPDEEPQANTLDPDEVKRHLIREGVLLRNEGSRFAYLVQGGECWLFVDGRVYRCSKILEGLVKTLCATRRLSPSPSYQTEEPLRLLTDLLNQGSLYIPED